MESWTSQPVGVATRYVHYVGENRIWLLVDAGWRAYATNDPAVKALIQDAFAAPNGFTVTVWYTEDKADHVQIARTVAP